MDVAARVIKRGRDVATIDVRLSRAGGGGELVACGTHVKKLVSASDLSPLFAGDLGSSGESPARPRSRL